MRIMTTLYEGGHAPQITQRHRLRIAREEAGYDQNTLAQAIGVSRNTINNAETGRVEPRRIVLNAWAMACGVPVSWIITGFEPGQPSPPDGGNGLLLPHLDSNQEPADYQVTTLRPLLTPFSPLERAA